MVNLPDWAEDYFALQCSEGNAKAHPPRRDANGWDYLIEIGETPCAGYADSKPPIQNAFAQVKSTIKSKREVSITLSNLLKACSSKSPWFLMLIMKKPNGARTMYGAHLWGDVIRRALTAVRKAELEGAALNLRRLTIPLPDRAIAEDLIPWMQQQIGSTGPDYAEAKISLIETLRHAEGFGEIQFSVEGTFDSFIDLFLGMSEGIVITDFSFTPKRFGFSDLAPKRTARTATLTVTPEPQEAITVKIYGDECKPGMLLLGAVYSAKLPPPVQNSERVRFSAPPLEIIVAPRGPKKFILRLNHGDRYSLRYFGHFCQLLQWKHEHGLSIDILGTGKQYSVKVPRAMAALTQDAEHLSEIVNALQALGRDYDMSQVQLSIEEMNRNLNDLAWFAQMTGPRSVRAISPVGNAIGPGAPAMIYYCYAQAGQWTFACQPALKTDPLSAPQRDPLLFIV